jgi:hypothetical protein
MSKRLEVMAFGMVAARIQVTGSLADVVFIVLSRFSPVTCMNKLIESRETASLRN